MNLFKRYLVLSVMLIVSLIAIGAGGYFYFYSMTTVNTNLNINRIDAQRKIYSYSVYNDFYFRITQIQDGEVSIYSEIVPVESKFGYDVSDNKFLLSTTLKNPLGLAERSSNEIDSDLIKTFRDFSKTFNIIVSTQSPYYINKATDRINKSYAQIWGKDSLIKAPSLDDFYEEEIKTPISNLSVKSFKLDYIKQNLNKFESLSEGEWGPNIFEYHFASNDRIYFQYFNKVESKDIYKEIRSLEEDGIYINTIKTQNNETYPLAFKIDEKEKSIIGLMQDNSGYTYLLKYVASNKRGLELALPDFLKLAYGIYFLNVQNFDSGYIDKFNLHKHGLRKNVQYINNSLLDPRSSSNKITDFINTYYELCRWSVEQLDSDKTSADKLIEKFMPLVSKTAKNYEKDEALRRIQLAGEMKKKCQEFKSTSPKWLYIYLDKFDFNFISFLKEVETNYGSYLKKFNAGKLFQRDFRDYLLSVKIRAPFDKRMTQFHDVFNKWPEGNEVEETFNRYYTLLRADMTTLDVDGEQIKAIDYCDDFDCLVELENNNWEL